MVSSSIPSGSGKKDNKRSCTWLRNNHPARDVQGYEERVTSGSQEMNEEETPHELVFVKDTSAITCFGCKRQVWQKPSSPPPPPPFDLFTRHCQRRMFHRKGETKISISTNPEMVYFHPSSSCCTDLSQSDVRDGKFVVDNDMKSRLNNSHKRHLFNKFGFTCD